MRHRHLTLILLLLTGLLFGSLSARAQENLLTNPGFENAGQYVDQRPAGSSYALAMAPGWQGWFTKQPSTADWMNIDPIAYPHTAEFTHEGNTSQNIGRGGGTFTAAAYQIVNDIPEGTTLRFRAWVFHDSEPGSGSQSRVGIGSNIGGNVLGDVKWSSWMTAIDSWQQLEVTATVPAGNVTVIIYSTQSQPKAGNQNYYDQASLVAIGSGEPDVGGDGGDDEVDVPAPPTSTPFDVAPFVNPQEGDDAGRVVHTVQSGDTLAAIAVAYGVRVDQIRQNNNLGSDVLQIGQQLLIREASAQPTEPAESEPEATDETGDDSGSSEVVSDDDVTTVAQASSPTPEPQPTDTPQPESAANDTEATEEITEETTEEATEEPTPAISPTPTPVPPTATDAPPAPVEEGADADPLATESEVCVLLFEDSNQNRIREAGEDLLANGIISLAPTLGGEAMQYTTDGTSEPYCFEGLEPGSYTASATAPDGYGITTSNNLVVSAPPGQRFQLRFGAAQGVEVAVAPTADGEGETIDQTAPETVEPDVSGIRSILGLVVIGMAAVVLVGGVAVALIMRGR